MEINLEITDVREGTYPPKGSMPLTLEEAGTVRILNRRILKWGTKGDYGTGSPGFFGILLAGNSAYPKEWLILRIPGSVDWLLLDGEKLQSQVNYKGVPNMPFFALMANMLGPLNFLLVLLIAPYHLYRLIIRPVWDRVWRKLFLSKICKFDITHDQTVIKTKNLFNFHVLETPSTRTNFSGDNYEIIKNNMPQAWVISRTGKIFC